jgi:radical SAM protein with 4Fe4S-binding SPASM domain
LKLQLNPEKRYVHDPLKGKGYILNAKGACSLLNSDAMTLLSGNLDQVQTVKEYKVFLEQAVQANWVIPDCKISVPVRKVEDLHHLKRVQLELLLQCNLECAHCYCSSAPSAPVGLPTKSVFKLIDEISAMGVLYLDITGGEPLLRKDIFSIIEHAHHRGLVVSLFTNATTLTEAKARKLADLNVASIQTSLDAYSPKLHDQFRGREGSFRKAIDGIRILRESQIPVSVTVMVHQQNKHEIKELTHFISRNLKVPFRLDRVIPALENSNIALSNEEFYGLIKRLYPNEQNLLTKVCDSSMGQIEKGHIEPSCGVGASYLFIKHNGDVVLCPTMTEKESPKFKAGNILTQSLRSIWLEDPIFQQFRGVQCQNIQICPAAAQCKGGCRSNAYLLHGSTDSPDEFNCNLHKNKQTEYKNYLDNYENGTFD